MNGKAFYWPTGSICSVCDSLDSASIWFQMRVADLNTLCLGKVLSVSHQTTHTTPVRCINSDVSNSVCVMIYVLLSVSPKLFSSSVLASFFPLCPPSCPRLCPFSSSFFPFTFTSLSIPLSLLPYFPHHRQHGESSAS